MKNKYSVLFVLLSIFSVAQIQPQFGAKAGLNYGVVDGGARTIENNIGFFIGATANVDLTEKFSIQSELLYSKYNIEYYWEDGNAENYYKIEREFNSSSILLPILANYEVINKLKLYAGPQLDFNLNTAFEFNKSDENGIKTGYPISGDAKDLDLLSLDAVIGSSYTYKEKYFIDLRYVYGFNKVVELDDAPHKSFIQFGLGYNFN